MSENNIVNKYFKAENNGYRLANFTDYIRYSNSNKIEILKYNNNLKSMEWQSISWKDFNSKIYDHAENKKDVVKDNDFANMMWDDIV